MILNKIEKKPYPANKRIQISAKNNFLSLTSTVSSILFSVLGDLQFLQAI